MRLPVSNVLTDSYNQFSLDLYKQVGSASDGNLFLCTFSILSALSMCLPGAKQNTEKQLKQIMYYENYTNNEIYESNLHMLNTLSTQSLGNKVTLNMANKIYPKNGFTLKQEFVDTLRRYYKVDVQSLDYSNPVESSSTINKWVEEQTMNKIKDLVPPSAISYLTRLILVNAIYFKGDWLKQFKPENTKNEPFYLLDGSSKMVNMMFLKSSFSLMEQPNGLKANILELPYDGEEISMSIILPNEGVHIKEIESQLLDAKVLKNVLESNNRKREVVVYLPKFKLEESIELSDTLSKMGLKDAFDQSKANFTGMSDSEQLFISKVLHKAVIEVSEEGTVAAGATAVIVGVKSCINCNKQPPVFKCNRPFIFMLHDNTNKTVLFIGRHTKP